MGFWTPEDERKLNSLRDEYTKLAGRRAGRRRTLQASDSSIGAETLYRARRLRDATFPGAELIFGEPGWDILLDLHSARVRGETVSLSSACLGARAPLTTGRRWLSMLEQLGLVERLSHPFDGRSQIVTLTDGATAIMERYLAHLSR